MRKGISPPIQEPADKTSPVKTYLEKLQQNQFGEEKVDMSFAADDKSQKSQEFSTQNIILQKGSQEQKETKLQAKADEVNFYQNQEQDDKDVLFDQNGPISRENRDLLLSEHQISDEAFVVPDIELLNFEMGRDEHQIKQKRFIKAAETTKRELKLAQVKFRTSDSDEMLQAEFFGNFTGKKLNTFKRESVNLTNVRNPDNFNSYDSLPVHVSRNSMKKDKFSSKLLATMQVKSFKNAQNSKGIQRVKTAKVTAKIGGLVSKNDHKITNLQTLGIKIDDKEVLLSK